MTATAALTTDLQRQVLALEDDLRKRLAADPELEGRWKQEHHRAVQKERTAAPWVSWRDDRVTQAGVAWVLATVFMRFCEDNGLLRPVWIAGPGVRRQEALDAQLAFFRQHPEDTDREWLQDAIGYLNRLPATRALVDGHSALHLVSPSGEAAGKLLEFWRRRDEDGALIHDLADPSLSTRFLGDLYQDLSQHAKDTYALLQTPVFVEEFILDRTLDPALAERPLEGFKLIDPACGSGHFLLGAFARLLDRWHKHAPDLETQARVQDALDSIHGVDLNPFAVAIARFRLTVAALQACGLRSLEQAPAFTFHLAVGDSLIHGPGQGVLPGIADGSAFVPFTYATEDNQLLLGLLAPQRYDVVVGNPPYITVKDKALNQIYRSKYADVCKGTYAMAVPFTKLIFDLAKTGDRPGWVGVITSNSFMKREFGTKLIENFLPRVDLQAVVDSEGAWIPGHNSDGTPTVILIGRNRAPVGGVVRSVLSKGKRETRVYGNEGKGPYWRAIVEHIDDSWWDDEWITVTDLDRSLLATHPWSLTGGGAVELQAAVESGSHRQLGDVISGKVGFASFPGADSAFSAPRMALKRGGVPDSLIRAVISGDVVRDWVIHGGEWALTPYDSSARLVGLDSRGWARRQWPFRTTLGAVTGFGGETKAQAGAPWWAWYRWVEQRYKTPWAITFAEVATHNNFVLDRGGRVFKQTAPVIKLSRDATDDEYLGLLGALNSSIACFWLRHVCKPKGGAAEHLWLRTYQFNGTRVSRFPLSEMLPVERARKLDSLAQDLLSHVPSAVCSDGVPTHSALSEARALSERIRTRMIAVQEELDWEVYQLYGLIDEDLTYDGDDLPELGLGERAFELALAQAVASGKEGTAWFSHPEQHSTPRTEIPAAWPAAYKEVVRRRLDLIATDKFIGLLERPEYKRRWVQEPWEKRQERALREWLLDKLEDRKFWYDAQGRPRPCSIAQLADEVARDPDLTSVLGLWEGRPDIPVTQSLIRMLADEAVPFLAAHRYKETGIVKRRAWEETWDLQRREDKGENVGIVPVPPEYTSADFRRPSYWQARGELDVPKERFVLYPDAGRETDPTPLLGWAGWDHAQQSLALSVVISEREKEGWADERLVPLVAGLAELQPWVEQWHDEVDAAYGLSLAAFCREQLTARAAQVGKTTAELAVWRPEAPTQGRRGARKG